MGTKKDLLHIFLELGQSCKGQPYAEALTKLTFSKSSETSSEWFPLNTIVKKYGMAELMRRVNKGTVKVRADPADPDEYEFQDVRKIDTDAQTEVQFSHVQRKDKIAIEDYIRVKSFSSISDTLQDGSAAHGF